MAKRSSLLLESLRTFPAHRDYPWPACRNSLAMSRPFHDACSNVKQTWRSVPMPYSIAKPSLTLLMTLSKLTSSSISSNLAL
jgi:hypothetical protein